MPQRPIVHCVICGRHISVCGRLSARHKCQSCGRRRLVENIDGLVTHSGDPWERYLAGMRRYVREASRVGQ